MPAASLLDGIVRYCSRRSTTSVRDLIRRFHAIQSYRVKNETVRAVDERYLNGNVTRARLMDGNTQPSVGLSVA